MTITCIATLDSMVGVIDYAEFVPMMVALLEAMMAAPKVSYV